nr:Holliday junction DNA helicase RuvB C-terminal domain-containing protein [Mycoplasmopsis cynos]
MYGFIWIWFIKRSYWIFRNLKRSFFEKYASLFTLTGLARFAKEDILTEIEPILLFYELIEKTSRGRRISSKGLDYLIRQNLFSK